MRKYNVFELSIINQKKNTNIYYFICKKSLNKDEYIEVLTNQRIKICDKDLIEPLANYYSILEVCNYTTRESLMLTIDNILDKYIEINNKDLNLSQSKIYKK